MLNLKNEILCIRTTVNEVYQMTHYEILAGQSVGELGQKIKVALKTVFNCVAASPLVTFKKPIRQFICRLFTNPRNQVSHPL
jgi:hypothetical protein